MNTRAKSVRRLVMIITEKVVEKLHTLFNAQTKPTRLAKKVKVTQIHAM